jgi:hypothetical protein
MREMRNVYIILAESWKTCTCNIKLDLREIDFEGTDWIHMTQDRDWWLALFNTVLNLLIPYKQGQIKKRASQQCQGHKSIRCSKITGINQKYN